MDLLQKSDEEILEIAAPFWKNLINCSNSQDYFGFTKNFSARMLMGANEPELAKQWANNEVITPPRLCPNTHNESKWELFEIKFFNFRVFNSTKS